MTVCDPVPNEAAVKVTEQEPESSVQAPPCANVPWPVLEKSTVPVGFAEDAVSLTATVHVWAVPAGAAGPQVRVVAVGSGWSASSSTRELPLSAMYRLPALSTATP